MWRLVTSYSNGEADDSETRLGVARMVIQVKFLCWSAMILLRTECNPIANGTNPFELSSWTIRMQSILTGTAASNSSRIVLFEYDPCEFAEVRMVQELRELTNESPRNMSGCEIRTWFTSAVLDYLSKVEIWRLHEESSFIGSLRGSVWYWRSCFRNRGGRDGVLNKEESSMAKRVTKKKRGGEWGFGQEEMPAWKYASQESEQSNDHLQSRIGEWTNLVWLKHMAKWTS